MSGTLPIETSSTGPLDRLPIVPEEVTAEWLGSKLGHKIKSIKITKSILATGSKLLFDITYDDGENATADDSRPASVCVKGGFDPEQMAQYPFLIEIYEREVEFFNHIAPNLVYMDLPRSYWAGHDRQNAIVIMEDLTQHGCTFGDPLYTWPVERVLAGVEQLAAMHAWTWGKSAKDYTWLTPHYDTSLLYLIDRWGVVALSSDRPPLPEYMHDAARVKAVFAKHYSSRAAKFSCLIHGDPHTGNTYFGARGQNPDSARFLDYQMVHVGSPFHDVTYFVGAALTVEDRREHEWRVLDHYLASLARFGGPVLDRKDKEVEFEYRKSWLSGVAWIVTPYGMQTKERVFVMVPRYIAAINDHKCFELVESQM
ncbi:hypothetical protein VSDG_01718 [Cytospora chrysosperma]|uniref:CHK kinase-like domain-containing protein n=1 Tax=Cytospora chrysosperma TaxID=252740 RepID=A0A423WHQ8_CYTCH|nr:hypothetical protein VSDG_01718 [Valsa sordida]